MPPPNKQLLSALIQVMNEDKAQVRINACAILTNLAVPSENRVFMTQDDFGLLPALIDVIKEDKWEAR